MAEQGIDVGVRDVGLLESALARPQTTVFGQDAYPDLWTKAAAVMHSIVSSHPLVDGNKRAGLAAALATLDLNGVDTANSDAEALYTLTMHVAEGKTEDVAELAARLQAAVTISGRGP